MNSYCHHEQGLEDILSGRTAIGIKRMGELDERPFQNACKRKYGNDDYETRAAELVSSWQEEIKKPAWHPYKFVKAEDGSDKVSTKFIYIQPLCIVRGYCFFITILG